MNFAKNHKIITFIAIIAVLYNVLWAFNYFSFKKLKGEYTKGQNVYYLNEKDYALTYKSPSYPYLDGNYAVINKDSSIRLIVWPPNLLKWEYRYIVYIHDKKSENEHIFYVDRDMNYLDTNDTGEEQAKKIKAILHRNKEELKMLLSILEDKYN